MIVSIFCVNLNPEAEELKPATALEADSIAALTGSRAFCMLLFVWLQLRERSVICEEVWLRKTYIQIHTVGTK